MLELSKGARGPPVLAGVIRLLIAETLIWSAGLWLLWLTVDWLSAVPGGFVGSSSRLRTPLAVYAIIPLLVSLSLRGGYIPRLGDWLFPPKSPPFARRCPGETAGSGKTAIDAFIRGCAARYGLDPLLVQAVVAVESNYDPRAVSRRGAMGLMQLTPDTAEELGIRNPFDPSTNIEGGMHYLRSLLYRHKARLPLALASYNAGPAKVKRYKGVPPYAETQDYVRKVTAQFQKLQRARKEGLARQ